MMKSSITDSPRNVSVGEKDNFKIDPFEKGLTKFIQHSNTPITIALQGEWGSGKTSLMNSLRENLCQSTESKFYDIWLNTWEYALMKDAESTLIDIIIKLIQRVSEIAGIGSSKKEKLVSGIKKIGLSALRISGAFHSIGGKMADELENSTNGSDATIGEIRDELESIIENFINQDSKNGFIFFIDDLDRIDPPVAVKLLEILKNIFTLKKCVFILAIDYDVVIKGLEPKFGKLSDTNEREFRSFFDKIIQVPFSMPVSSYKVDEFLKESLLSIDYINKDQSKNIDLITKFSEISNLSVGKNPRALKRLMNSLSLINCINSAKENSIDNNQLNEDLEFLVNFALVSIQIAYPPVYRLLSKYPGFTNWNENTALELNLKTLDKISIEKLNQSVEFDEDWEKILFRLCEVDHYLKKRALSVSRLLNMLKMLIENQEEEIEDIIGGVISLSSVTNLEAFDKEVIDYHVSSFLKNIRGRLIPKLKCFFPNNQNEIKQIGKRVQVNFKFSLLNNVTFRMSSWPKDGKVNLYLFTNIEYGKDIGDFKEDLKNNNLLDEFASTEYEYQTEMKEKSPFLVHDLFDIGTWKYKKIIYSYINFHSDLVLPKPEDFYTSETIDVIANHILLTNKYRSKILKLIDKRNIK
ncbi:P-loop NTPase fold protein [uncultured Polaribacter sp.]|uniref:KAP family P-loop NTPase fold protein n=1 Tax=uncultured Polaribacter sp. TaxID=174711 RepID=UPI00262D339B|nr:P-loop NTPase fold protein [uncultured Polaribacter sp.]